MDENNMNSDKTKQDEDLKVEKSKVVENVVEKEVVKSDIIENDNKESDRKYKISYGNASSSSSSNARNVLAGMLGGIIGTLLVCAIIYGFIKTGSINLYSNNESGTTTKNIQIEKVSDAPIAVAEKLGSSIVGIIVTSTQQNVWGMLQEGEEEGSGIIYSQDGYIITNYHVIQSAYSDKNAKIKVILPDVSDAIDATIVGVDKTTDLAVIKIDKTGLPAAQIGDSSTLKVGEMVIAIGNPLGMELKGSVTVGYVSALNRMIQTDGKQFNLIQTDAAINPGNSGGALANAEGKVIGISNIKMSGNNVEGLGFAIPINDAKPIIDELISNKKIARPYIGIYGRDVSEADAIKYNLTEGIYVSSIIEYSPAEKAGIKATDVIVKVDGKAVKTMDELNAIKNAKKIGDKLELTVNRQGKEMTVKLTLEESQD